MKKYRLKKDLPTFKAGEVFTIGSDRGLWKDKGEQVPILVYSRQTLARFPDILTDWFEEIPEEPKTVFDLGDGDECWIRDIDLKPRKVEWRGTPYDNQLRELGLVFLSREALEKDDARRKAEVILERDTKGFKPNWEDVSNKYEVYYDYESRELDTECYNTCCSHSNLWFESSKDAKASIKNHEKEWKIYLGVEE